MRVFRSLRWLHLGGALIAAAACAGQLQAADQAEGLQDIVVRGLRWYFHWEEPFPRAKFFGCRAGSFGANYFVYCNPGGETLNLTRNKSGEWGVNVISTTDQDEAAELRHFASYQSAPASGGFLISVESITLAVYDIDIEVSRAHMMAARARIQDLIRLYEKDGHRVRCLFPLVSKGDPFYEVYVLEGDQVVQVDLYWLAGGAIQGSPHWSYDIPHRNIPVAAQANAADLSRWFAELPAQVISLPLGHP